MVSTGKQREDNDDQHSGQGGSEEATESSPADGKPRHGGLPFWAQVAGLVGAFVAVVGLAGLYINALSERDSQTDKVRTLQAAVAYLSPRAKVGTWAFQQCRVSTQEIERIAPAFQFPPGGPGGVPVAEIVNPPQNARVDSVVDAEGKLCGSVPKGGEIWIAVVIPGVSNGYYPQGSYKDHAGPVTIRRDNTWVSHNVVLGDPKKDRGRTFVIATIVANSSASGSLWSYLRQGEQTKPPSFPPISLPAGAEDVARVTVVRK